MRKRQNIGLMLLVVFTVMTVMLNTVVGAPTGATLNPGNSTRGTDPTATTVDAQAGNVTQLNIDQTRITDIWQGFYGNVSGTIVLENSAGQNFYDWTGTEVTGQIYASRYAVPDWSGINCSNSTHWEEEETELTISSTATDGINETFNTYTHPTFDVGSVTIDSNVCPATRPYTSGETAGVWYNVMLNSNSSNTVYTVVVSSDGTAYDGTTVDFEILVPTDTTQTLTSYYFYAELN